MKGFGTYTLARWYVSTEENVRNRQHDVLHLYQKLAVLFRTLGVPVPTHPSY